jgi:hypothetical protein
MHGLKVLISVPVILREVMNVLMFKAKNIQSLFVGEEEE